MNSTFNSFFDYGESSTTVVSFSFTNWLVNGGKFFITGIRGAGTDTIQSLGITIEV
jgi:hypothetical protein